MTCSPCQHAANRWARPVTLEDGREVCNHCEAWRLECLRRHDEASNVVRMLDIDDRRTEVRRITELRGAEAGRRLEAEVRRLWAKRREAITGIPETAQA